MARLDKPEPGTVKHAFAEWLLTPPSEREHASQQAFAEANGMSRITMSAWKKEPGFQRYLNERMEEMNLGPDKIQQVVEALHKEAARGDVQAAKAYMAYVESLRPIVKQIEDPDVQAMSEEDIDLELRQLLDG